MEDYNMWNKHYRDVDHGSFDIAGALGRPCLTKDGNESLVMMGTQKKYIDIAITERATLVRNGTEVSTFTTNTPPFWSSIKTKYYKRY